MQRPLPEVPIRVAFLGFSELLDAATKLATPWVVLRSSSDTLIIGKTDCNADIEVKVVFRESFIPTVTYKGKLTELLKRVKGLIFCMENRKVLDFLILNSSELKSDYAG